MRSSVLVSVILAKKIILLEDFESYADSTALQAVWTAIGTAPLLTLKTGKVARLENGGAANSWAYRSFPTQVGRVYRATARLTAKGSNSPRIEIGTTANGGDLLNLTSTPFGGPTVGLHTGTFIAVGTTTFVDITTTSVSLGDFGEFDDIKIETL